MVVAQDELDAAKAAQVAAREELKAAKKAAKVEAKAEAKAAAKAEKAAAKAEKKAAKVTKKAENIVAKAAQKVEMKSAKATAKATKVAAKEAEKVANIAAKQAEKEAAAATKAAQAAVKAEADAAKLAAKVAERKNWASRLVAIALMLVSVVVLVILSFGAVIQFVTVGENAVPDVKYGSLMTIVMTAMKSETKMFGLIPALFTGAGSELYNASVYVFVLCVVVSAILAVAANINIVKAPKRVRRSLFILGLGSLIYAGAMALLLKNASISAASFAKLNMISIAGYYFDAFSLLLGGACMFISLVVYIQRKLVQE